MPSCSIGFCVAITRKGLGRSNRLPPIVVCRSCMASSIADWVFALDLLISSSRMMCACTGPSLVSNAPVDAL